MVGAQDDKSFKYTFVHFFLTCPGSCVTLLSEGQTEAQQIYFHKWNITVFAVMPHLRIQIKTLKSACTPAEREKKRNHSNMCIHNNYITE